MKSIEFQTAQYVQVQYELASPIQRVVSFVIDFFAFIVYMIIMALLLDLSQLITSPTSSLFLTLLVIKLPWIFYHPLSEYFFKGQSLGKYILGIRVVTLEGERPGFKEIVIRWIFRGDFIWISADLMVLLWVGFGIVGFFMSSTSDLYQRMGDRMANVVVVRNKASVKYELSDVLSIKTKTNYEPRYPQVVQFTDEDMLLIKNALTRIQLYPNEATKAFVMELADRLSGLLGIEEPPTKKIEFLRTVLEDYVVLTR